MAKRDDIKNQLKKQHDEVYGEETQSGSAPSPDSDDNTLSNLRDVVGDDINPGDEFYLADEIVGDEKARLAGRFNTAEEEEEDDEIDDVVTEDDEDSLSEDENTIPLSDLDEDDEE